jgi:hypothetical protein
MNVAQAQNNNSSSSGEKQRKSEVGGSLCDRIAFALHALYVRCDITAQSRCDRIVIASQSHCMGFAIAS